jgi:glycosyltransferase involved in cell wall biosynthesis
MKDITVIILTYNEEKHIERCINSVKPFAKQIFVVDSYSTDKTKKIVESSGARFYTHAFKNQSQQLNWALENLPIRTRWVMRLDADEYPTHSLVSEIIKKIDRIKENVNGIYIKRRVYFMGRWIQHGGYYPIYLLRIWKFGKAMCENKLMDEHILLSQGKTINFEHDLVDYNKNNLSWWIQKHNNYSTREAIELLNLKYGLFNYPTMNTDKFNSQDKRKRWIKNNIYSKSPLFLRPVLYFIHRYFLRFGFLDGWEGLIYHFLQGFWYRFLVDAKIYEIYLRAGKNKKKILEHINNKLNQK